MQMDDSGGEFLAYSLRHTFLIHFGATPKILRNTPDFDVPFLNDKLKGLTNEKL